MYATLALLGVAGCGRDGGAPRAPSPATATAAASPAGAGVPGSLTVVAKDLRFSTDSLAAQAGDVVLRYINADTGIPHNLAVYPSGVRGGAPLAQTDIEVGPNEQTLTVRLEPGTYRFTCMVHNDMRGMLTVE